MTNNIMIAHPCPGFPLTQPFGVNKDRYAIFGLEGHPGLDYATPVGTPILACFAGTVAKIETSPPGYGLYILLKHACFWSLYAHLGKITPTLGEWIAKGQPIALSGGAAGDPNAGNSTGPHLHFEIRPFLCGLPGYGGAIDPQPFIERDSGSKKAIVLASYLNIRQGPSVNTPIIGSARHGLTVEFDLEENGWIRILQPRKGWINRQFVQVQR